MNTPWKSLFGVALCAAVFTSAPAAEPVLGKSPRYCNPLPIINSGGASASGDVTVIRDNGKYYMYCTGGGAWVSDDLLHWTFQRVANVPVAPDVVKYNGVFYMCGNSGPLLKADNPLGPFTRVGDWPEKTNGWYGSFDMHIYIDDGNKPYLYYPGRGVTGIKMRDEDFVEHLFIASTHAYILIFTNTGRVYWLKVYEIPDVSAAGKGKHVGNLVGLQPGESVRTMLAVRNLEEEGKHILFATRNGLVKKTELKEFCHVRSNGIYAISIERKIKNPAVAAICVPLAGRKSTPEMAVPDACVAIVCSSSGRRWRAIL